MDKVDFEIRQTMEKSLLGFVQWAKATDLNLLPPNFDLAQESYSKDLELIKRFLQLTKKQHDAIAEFGRNIK